MVAFDEWIDTVKQSSWSLIDQKTPADELLRASIHALSVLRDIEVRQVFDVGEEPDRRMLNLINLQTGVYLAVRRLAKIADRVGCDARPIQRLPVTNHIIGYESADLKIPVCVEQAMSLDRQAIPDALAEIRLAALRLAEQRAENTGGDGSDAKVEPKTPRPLPPRYEAAVLAIGWARKERPDLVVDDQEITVSDELYDLIKEECPHYKSDDKDDPAKQQLPKKATLVTYLRKARLMMEGPRVAPAARDHGPSIVRGDKIEYLTDF